MLSNFWKQMSTIGVSLKVVMDKSTGSVNLASDFVPLTNSKDRFKTTFYNFTKLPKRWRQNASFRSSPTVYGAIDW